jgi:hypothetical protein
MYDDSPQSFHVTILDVVLVCYLVYNWKLIGLTEQIEVEPE